jgi:hypothetical protein
MKISKVNNKKELVYIILESKSEINELQYILEFARYAMRFAGGRKKYLNLCEAMMIKLIEAVEVKK